MPLKNGLKLLSKAMEEDTQEYAFRIYLASYPNMTQENFKTFNEFYEEIKPKKVELDTRSKDEIMQEILVIEKSFEKGGN